MVKLQQTWAKELERRAREVAAGTAKTSDAHKMLQRVKRKLQLQKLT